MIFFLQHVWINFQLMYYHHFSDTRLCSAVSNDLLLLLHPSGVGRASCQAVKEGQRTHDFCAKCVWKSHLVPETTLFFMDVWWNNHVFYVMIWCHPVETTNKTSLFRVPGRYRMVCLGRSCLGIWINPSVVFWLWVNVFKEEDVLDDPSKKMLNYIYIYTYIVCWWLESQVRPSNPHILKMEANY